MGNLNGCKIAYKSLGAGAFDYSFTLDNEFFSRFEGSEILGGDCSANVQLQRGETMLEVDVEIDGQVLVACDRCLEPCPVEIYFDDTLIVKLSDQAQEYDGEILWLSPSESELDLSQYIYESVVLTLPYQRVHAQGECNAEMISKFATITAQQAASMALLADDEQEQSDAESDADDEQTHGLAAGDLAKLLALKEQLESK
ncbi:MAG: DUF177 domain-containing protein [Rikenellaceae bacterium]